MGVACDEGGEAGGDPWAGVAGGVVGDGSSGVVGSGSARAAARRRAARFGLRAGEGWDGGEGAGISTGGAIGSAATGVGEMLTGATGGSGSEGGTRSGGGSGRGTAGGVAIGSVTRKSAVMVAGASVRMLGGAGGAKASARLANSARSSSERSGMEES
jgi:hypothetical protein